MIYKYIVDANVLLTSQVSRTIDTDFFKNSCIVIEEIAYELADTNIGTNLKQIAQPVSAQILIQLGEIIDDLVKLGILKSDHGNGDALLIATGLSIREGAGAQASLAFMQEHPIIVTNEKLVDAYAKSKGLDAINGKEFVQILNHEAIGKIV